MDEFLENERGDMRTGRRNEMNEDWPLVGYNQGVPLTACHTPKNCTPVRLLSRWSPFMVSMDATKEAIAP